jgi:hypothetical protein
MTETDMRPWEERREEHPQHVHSHWFRCQSCNEPFSEHAAGRVLPDGTAICGACLDPKPTRTCERCGGTSFGFFAGPTGRKTRCRNCGLAVANG